MKKIIFTLSLSLISIMGFSQLEVYPNKNVGIGTQSAANGFSPNQTLVVDGTTRLSCKPSQWSLYFENYNNNAGGGGPYNEPLIRGHWGHCAWLGNSQYPFWSVYAHTIYSSDGSVSTYSDRRIKKNVQGLASTEVLQKIIQLKGYTYDLDPTMYDNVPEEKQAALEESSKNKVGFIAQELKDIFPELVSYDESADLYAVKYSMMIPYLVEAIKAQQIEINRLKEEIESRK